MYSREADVLKEWNAQKLWKPRFKRNLGQIYKFTFENWKDFFFPFFGIFLFYYEESRGLKAKACSLQVHKCQCPSTQWLSLKGACFSMQSLLLFILIGAGSCCSSKQ